MNVFHKMVLFNLVCFIFCCFYANFLGCSFFAKIILEIFYIIYFLEGLYFCTCNF